MIQLSIFLYNQISNFERLFKIKFNLMFQSNIVNIAVSDSFNL